ncbi:MAG: hypothetical protein IKK08_11495 [Clostridia bacterium]|nr:hypothetical protein [Clostridia bacterium]
MTNYAWSLPLAFLLLIVPVILTICWFRNERYTGANLMWVSLFVIASITVLRLPLRLSWGETFPDNIMHSLIDALQTISLGADLENLIKEGVRVTYGETIRTFADTVGNSRIYASFVIVQCIIGILLSAFAVIKTVTGGIQRWLFRIFSFRRTFVFSRLTEESIMLAKNIQNAARAKHKKISLCFAAAQEDTLAALNLQWKAAGLKNVICFPKNIEHKCFPVMARGVNCILCSGEEDENLQQLYDLLRTEKDARLHRKRSIKYFVVAHSRNAERTVDGLMDCYIRSGESSSIVYLINPAENLAINVLDSIPLFKYAAPAGKNSTKLNILVAGSTPFAERFVRNAYVCGQMLDCSLSITWAATNADELEAELYAGVPALKRDDLQIVNECGRIGFHQLKSWAEIADEAMVGKAHYIVLANEKDEENIKAARRIRRIIELQKLTDPDRSSEKVAVLYRVESAAMNEIDRRMDEAAAKKQHQQLYTPCDMIPIGSREEMYAAEMFFFHDMLCKGYFVDRVYISKNPKEEMTLENVQKTLDRHKRQFSEFLCGMRGNAGCDNADKRSSVASALHLNYRMHVMNASAEPGGKPDAALMERLADTEHRRWTANTIMSGYMPPTPEQLESYFRKGGYSHKNMDLYLHPCIISSRPGVCPGLWKGEGKPDGLDQLAYDLHSRTYAMLDDAVREGCKAGALPALTLPDPTKPESLQPFVEAVEELPASEARSRVLVLANNLFKDFKSSDRKMVDYTSSVIRIAADPQVSDALRLFWLDE